MTRIEAKEFLKKLGIEEPTEDQVTNYLNQLEGETNGLKTKLSNAEKKAQDVATLEAQLKALEDSKLSEEEKKQKAEEEAQKTIEALNAKVKSMEMKSQLAEKGIIGEDADKLIESFNGGSLDVELLGKILTQREETAAKKKEQEIADKSTNPGGSGSAGGNPDDNEPDDVKNAKLLAETFGHTKSNDDNKNYYVLN